MKEKNFFSFILFTNQFTQYKSMLHLYYYIFAVQLINPWFVSKPNLKTPTVLIGDRKILNKNLKEISKKPLVQRIKFWSKLFIGTPYGLDPVGEEGEFDSDPPFNPYAVDCETYVEQTLALSFSSNVDEMYKWLNLMRYHGGERNFHKRFYTMVLSWIPGNVKLGYLKPVNNKVTRKIFKLEKKIHPNFHWFKSHKKRFDLLGKYAPKGNAFLRYVPISLLLDRYKRIPTPSIAFIVSNAQSRNPFLITHMGLILKNKKGELIFRHASGTPSRKKVEERKFVPYLYMLRKYFNNKNRRYVLGLSLYQIIDPEIKNK
jgi:N-acetylmuramoyl-L-alanine amidase-like